MNEIANYNWTGFCEVRVEQARSSSWVRKSLRTLLGPTKAPSFFANHDLPWDVDTPVKEGPNVPRVASKACVHLGVMDPPSQPRCGCIDRTFRCGWFEELVTVVPNRKGHKTCQGCQAYEAKS